MLTAGPSYTHRHETNKRFDTSDRRKGLMRFSYDQNGTTKHEQSQPRATPQHVTNYPGKYGDVGDGKNEKTTTLIAQLTYTASEPDPRRANDSIQ